MEAENEKGSKAWAQQALCARRKVLVTKVVDEHMRLTQNKAEGGMG